jgi:4-hydroxyproline epimerase
MARHTFDCIDAHTCGNPVRVVTSGRPELEGATMSERRMHFLKEYDWIRTGLMFEPRGHDMMSGALLYPPTRDDAEIGFLFIETSGCLPMCGHGTIGTVTVIVQEGIVKPRTPGRLRIEVPAGLIEATYTMNGPRVSSVRLVNVPSFLYKTGIEVECPDLGALKMDVAYGGNFYGLLDPQENYPDLSELSAKEILEYSPVLRERVNGAHQFVHPVDATISGLSHIEWTGKPVNREAHGRNAVFYGDHAIDRSPCGTGTSARMAQLHAKGMLKVGADFVHESYIGSMFRGRVESETTVGGRKAIVPSVEGWAKVTGVNRIFIDDDDPYARGFQVA